MTAVSVEWPCRKPDWRGGRTSASDSYSISRSTTMPSRNTQVRYRSIWTRIGRVKSWLLQNRRNKCLLKHSLENAFTEWTIEQFDDGRCDNVSDLLQYWRRNWVSRRRLVWESSNSTDIIVGRQRTLSWQPELSQCGL